jgi:hypothetical protein
LQRGYKAASWFYMLIVYAKLPNDISKVLITIVKQQALTRPNMMRLQVVAKEEALPCLVLVLFERL